MHFTLTTVTIYLFAKFVQGSSFHPREATISSVHHSLYTGLTTCREIASAFLSRIETLNPHINAVIALDPHVLDIADEYDTQLQFNNGSAYSPLFCIPTLLKDNYNTASMPTTGGSLALANSQPSTDAPVVKALKAAGALILGKTNLHELALEGITVSSLGGQTLNPYDFTRTPGGSSGGTGAAIAASLAVWGTGTDTVNSLRSPASANGLWSLRPSRGLISRAGVIPVSFTQDVLGPIARCVEDLAIALGAMARANEFDVLGSDNATAGIPAGVKGTNYAEDLKTGPSLEGMRFGLLEGFFNRSEGVETDPVNEAMRNMKAFLEQSGATVVPIAEKVYNATQLLELDTQRYEFRELMDEYLSNPALGGTHPASLAELYGSEKKNFLVLPIQYPFIHNALRSSTSNATYLPLLEKISNLKRTLKATFTKNDLDAVIYPEQKNLVVPLGFPSQSGRNGILAALTGWPVVTVPAGWSAATKSAKRGIPVGMEILGKEWNEGKLLQIAWRIQEAGIVGRRSPEWIMEDVGLRGDYERVPVVVPERENVPRSYVVGQIGD
jgi:Asp-tRNA(Asn)/Glu-tRNA(Gln) amidotransferase A subunit family amidase